MLNIFFSAAEAGGEPYVENAVFGVTATAWVSIAMLVLVGIILWKKVPAMIGASLDNKIAEIRAHLDEAKNLREEAEKIRSEYESKLACAVSEADDMKQRAEQEAESIIAEAKDNATALIARRKKMAEQKIQSAERAAIADIQAHVADTAILASKTLVEKQHDADKDSNLINETIAGLEQALGKSVH